MPKIFISYRRIDSQERAHRIADWFVLKYGRENVFIDIDAIGGGNNFVTAINNSLDESDVVLVVIGDQWVDEFAKRKDSDELDFVRLEVSKSLENVPLVIPVLLDRQVEIDGSRLPDDVQGIVHRNYMYARLPDFHQDMERLRNRIDAEFEKSSTSRFKGCRSILPAFLVAFTIVAAIVSGLIYGISEGWFMVVTDVPTQTLASTNTPEPVYTATSTNTLIPTETPSSTDTQTPSNTPTATQTSPPTNTLIPSQMPPSIGISFVDNRTMTIFIDSESPVSLNGLRFVTEADGIVPLDLYFPELQQRRLLSSGTCLVFRSVMSEQTPLPTYCNSSLIYEANPDSIFWYNFALARFVRFSVHTNQQELGICDPANMICRFEWIPHTTIVQPIGESNLGELLFKDIDRIKANLTLDDWYSQGFSGDGIRVGLIDQHFSGLDGLTGQFSDIVLTTRQDIASYNDDNFTQGTNVIEVIHELAPNAELFACRYNSYIEFTDCTQWMIENNVNIIQHSSSIPVFNVDGQSDWDAEVAKAKDAGILWINGAGNFNHSRYEERFEDKDEDGFVEFRLEENDEILPLNSISHTSGIIMLTWTDRNQPANAIDLDLRIIDLQTLEPIAFSENRQLGLGGNQPIEIATFNMTEPFGIQIVDYNGLASDTSTDYALFIEFTDLTDWGANDQTITAPASSPFALTVGSLQGEVVAPYSSRGALRDKSSIQKPDIVAPGEIQLSNGTRFVGTSASASVVTGFAALVWEYLNIRVQSQFGDGSIAPREEIWDYLRSEAVIPKFSLYDVDYGYGYLQPPPPDLSLPTPIPMLVTATPTLFRTTTPSPIPTQAIPIAVVNVVSAHLRSGPGEQYSSQSSASLGDEFTILAQSVDGNWYFIDRVPLSPLWISKSTVDIVNPQNILIPIATETP